MQSKATCWANSAWPTLWQSSSCQPTNTAIQWLANLLSCASLVLATVDQCGIQCFVVPPDNNIRPAATDHAVQSQRHGGGLEPLVQHRKYAPCCIAWRTRRWMLGSNRHLMLSKRFSAWCLLSTWQPRKLNFGAQWGIGQHRSNTGTPCTAPLDCAA